MGENFFFASHHCACIFISREKNHFYFCQETYIPRPFIVKWTNLFHGHRQFCNLWPTLWLNLWLIRVINSKFSYEHFHISTKTEKKHTHPDSGNPFLVLHLKNRILIAPEIFISLFFTKYMTFINFLFSKFMW